MNIFSPFVTQELSEENSFLFTGSDLRELHDKTTPEKVIRIDNVILRKIFMLTVL
jgi:hypothetical protein